MKTKKRIIKVGFIIVLACAAIFLLTSQTTTASDKTYKINPSQHMVKGYASDVDRIMDSYERLMGRYMDMVDGNMKGVGSGTNNILVKLSSIGKKIDNLDERIARIEKALKIKPPKETKKSSTK